MGQQQLLLLVLATVIVGLATVAGIQAFDENRNQAAADALNQKAAELAADVKGIYEKPEQLGGLPDSLSDADSTEINNKLGIQGGVTVPAAEGTCVVSNVTSNPGVVFECSGDDSGDYSDISAYGVFNPDSDPEVRVESTDPNSTS